MRRFDSDPRLQILNVNSPMFMLLPRRGLTIVQILYYNLY
jgi:hypothetical protein